MGIKRQASGSGLQLPAYRDPGAAVANIPGRSPIPLDLSLNLDLSPAPGQCVVSIIFWIMLNGFGRIESMILRTDSNPRATSLPSPPGQLQKEGAFMGRLSANLG